MLPKVVSNPDASGNSDLIFRLLQICFSLFVHLSLSPIAFWCVVECLCLLYVFYNFHIATSNVSVISLSNIISLDEKMIDKYCLNNMEKFLSTFNSSTEDIYSMIK